MEKKPENINREDQRVEFANDFGITNYETIENTILNSENESPDRNTLLKKALRGYKLTKEF